MTTTIIKIGNREQPYTVVDKTIGEDSRLSWGARGLLLHLLGKPPTWKVHVNDLVNRSPAGRDAVRAIIAELLEFGYLTTTENRDESGRITRRSYVVHETPEKPHLEQTTPESGFPTVDSEQTTPESGFPASDNPPLVIKDNSEEENITPEQLSQEAAQKSNATTKATGLLESVGIVPKVAAELATQHSYMSIFNAVQNGRAKQEVHKTLKRPFKLCGYVVQTLNTAFNENHEVQPSALRAGGNRTDAQKAAADVHRNRNNAKFFAEFRRGA